MLLNDAFSLSEHEVGALGINIRVAKVHVRGRVKSITQDTKLDVMAVITIELHETTGNGGQHFFSVFAKFLASATRSGLPARVNGCDISHALSVPCT